MSTHSIPSDPHVIRTFIMYDALLEKPVFEGYKDICKIIPQFDYPEYDYWYHSFLAGYRDVNYDRSADPKPLTFDDLPLEILEKIVEPLDVKKRFEVRKLSRTMLSVVDQLKMNYDKITIICDKDSVVVYVEAGDSAWELQYIQQSGGCRVSRNCPDRLRMISGGNFMEIALHDLGIILKPTKIRVEEFVIDAQDLDILKQIVDLLVSISKTKNSKFHVKSAKLEFPECSLALSVLSVMKPGVLENLDIGYTDDWDEPELFDMNQIKKMEQFKQARSVKLTDLGVIQSRDLVLFSNFEKFDVRVQSMEPEDVLRLRDDLSMPDNSMFQNCSILLQTPIENIAGIARALGENIPIEETFKVQHSCAIANSEKFLHFLIQNDEIRVEKDDPTPPDRMYHYEEDSDDDLESDEDPASDMEWENDEE